MRNGRARTRHAQIPELQPAWGGARFRERGMRRMESGRSLSDGSKCRSGFPRFDELTDHRSTRIRRINNLRRKMTDRRSNGRDGAPHRRAGRNESKSGQAAGETGFRKWL